MRSESGALDASLGCLGALFFDPLEQITTSRRCNYTITRRIAAAHDLVDGYQIVHPPALRTLGVQH